MNSLKIDSLEPRICETAIYKKFFSSFQIWPNRMAMKNFIFVVAFLLQVEKGQFEGYSNKGRCNQNLYLNKQYILFSKNLHKFHSLTILLYQKILWNTSFLGKGLLDFVSLNMKLHNWYCHNIMYSIVKDISADLGVNFKIVQNRTSVKAVCTKISNVFFCIFVNTLIFLSENKKVHFFYFEYLS